MLITMKHTARGSQDSFKVERFEEGKTYDVAALLATAFLRRGVAVKAKP